MTSRERLLRTFRREPVDRVPISTYELNGYNPDSFENRAPPYRAEANYLAWIDAGLRYGAY